MASTEKPHSRLALLFVLSTVCIDAIGIGLIMPVMPELLVELGGGGLSQAAIWGGVLATVFAANQFLFGPAMGSLSDHFGRRSILLISLAVMAVDYVIMGLATSIWLLVVARIIGGMMAANQTAAGAVIADISEKSRKAQNFGMLGAAFGAGFFLGPLLGGLLSEYGARAPFFVAAAVVFALLLVGIVALPETLPHTARRKFSWRRAQPFEALRSVGRLPGLAPLMTVTFLYELAFIVYPTVWAYYTIEKFGWTPKIVGISLACFGVMMVVVQGGLIRLIIPLLGERRTLNFGITMNCLAFSAYAFAPHGWVIFVIIPLTTLGALTAPALQGLMSQSVADDAQGELQGVVSGLRGIAVIGGPLLMASVFAFFTRPEAPIYFPGAPFIVALFIMVFAASIVVTEWNTHKKRPAD